MSFSENLILHIHELMTSIAGYDLSGKYKEEDNLIMEIDESGRRKVRFTPVPAADTKDAIVQNKEDSEKKVPEEKENKEDPKTEEKQEEPVIKPVDYSRTPETKDEYKEYYGKEEVVTFDNWFDSFSKDS